MMQMRRSRGFSMIELLVAVLVVGIGVLGATGLQMISLQHNRGAVLRSEAVQLAYDIMDRIRANPKGNYGIALGAGPTAAPDCLGGVCSDAQMVSFDQASWKCSLGGFNADAVCDGLRAGGVLAPTSDQPGLPSGDGSIAVDGATGLVTVTVSWQEQNMPNPTSISIESQG
jgi:type IV pilus assembly protein PilV